MRLDQVNVTMPLDAMRVDLEPQKRPLIVSDHSI